MPGTAEPANEIDQLARGREKAGGTAARAPESEIMRAYREWRELVDGASPDLRFEKEARILRMPARDVRDVLAKLMIISLEGELDPTGHADGEAVFAEAVGCLTEKA